MLRTILIYLSQANWARQIVTRWSFARKAASRFIAGEELGDAIKVIKTLNSKNINATLTHLTFDPRYVLFRYLSIRIIF